MFSLPRAFSLRAAAKRSALSLGLVLISGCGYLPFSDGSAADVAGKPKPLNMAHDLSTFLNSTPESTARLFAKSPWGDDVVVKAGPVYHAATGASCRRLLVEGAGAAQREVACAGESGQWHRHRLVVSVPGNK